MTATEGVLQDCVVAEAFQAVADRTGLGATLKEIDLELRSHGHELDAAAIAYALHDVDGSLLVERARRYHEPVLRDGWQVFLEAVS